MKPNLQKLIAEGFEEVTFFGDCPVYKNGSIRVIYNLISDKEILRYDFKTYVRVKE